MSLWEEYNEIHPEFLKRVGQIDNVSQQKIIKKLKAEKDRMNFMSTISEFLFLEFFKSHDFSVEYDKKYTDLNLDLTFTPDLTVAKFNQDIIVEVFKLNTTKIDLEKDNFIQYFFANRYSIQKDIDLFLILNRNATIDFNSYDKQKIISELIVWIKNDITIDDIFKVDENLHFKICKINTGRKHVGFASYSSVEFDISRLNSQNSSLLKKINKYELLLKNNNKPYIICLIMNIDTAINEMDVFWKIYGDLVFNRSASTYYSELNGLFYSISNAKKYLSGLLLMINGTCFYFHNFLENKLNIENKDFLSSYQYYLKDLFPSRQVWYELSIKS